MRYYIKVVCGICNAFIGIEEVTYPVYQKHHTEELPYPYGMGELGEACIHSYFIPGNDVFVEEDIHVKGPSIYTCDACWHGMDGV